jgi:DNA-binding NtrC family response regulator
MSEGDQLDLGDFPLLTSQPHPATDIPTAPLMLEPIAAPSVVSSGSEIPIAPLPSVGTLPMLTATGDVRPLEDMENEIIRFAISHYRGQMSEVARRLKIGRSTLYRKLDEAGVPGHGGKSGEETH